MRADQHQILVWFYIMELRPHGKQNMPASIIRYGIACVMLDMPTEVFFVSDAPINRYVVFEGKFASSSAGLYCI